MRATEFLTEVFQPGKTNWEWKRRNDHNAIASFAVGDREYQWDAFTQYGDANKWEIQFRLLRKNDDPDELNLFGKTGTGNSAEVMSTAVDITREFIKEYGDKVSEITFNAKEDSRIGLYAKMIQRLLPEWELNQVYNKSAGTEFHLTNPKADRTIDEAEVGTPNAKEIANQLKAAGYSNVGSGADSTVWAKDENYIIKILMPEDLGTKAEQVFRKFYEFAMSHQDLACVPRFNEVNTVDINGKDYTQIEMERLAPIEKGTFMEGVVWFFSDFCQAQEAWDNVDRAMGLLDTWEGYPYTKNSKSIANIYISQWQDLMYDKKAYSMYRQLYNVMKLLYNTGTINKFGWDLHTENVMQRKNGQPVIIDPWFSEGTS